MAANTCGTVENGAVSRDQIADAGRRGQHFRHHDADDGERAAQPQAGQHRRDGRGNDHPRDLLRQGGAHAAGGQQVLRIDGADAGGGRQHHREEAVDAGEGDLGLRADAEPGGEDRVEDHDRHGIEAGEDRQHQVAQHGDAAHQRADQDAGAAGDQHGDGDLGERDHQRMGVLGAVDPQDGQRLGERGQEELGDELGAGQQLPQHQQGDQKSPADGGGGGTAHHRPTRSCGSAARSARAAGRTCRSPSFRRCAGGAGGSARGR